MLVCVLCGYLCVCVCVFVCSCVCLSVCLWAGVWVSLGIFYLCRSSSDMHLWLCGRVHVTVRVCVCDCKRENVGSILVVLYEAPQ